MVAGAAERMAGQRDSDVAADYERLEVGTRLRLWLRSVAAAQQGRGFLWWPIALSFGIWFYFGLAVEPSNIMIALCLVLALVLAWLGRNSAIVLLAALLVAGFVMAKLRSELTATPLLRATTAEVVVTGRVAAVDRASHSRLTIILEPDSIEGLTQEKTPRRLRLSSPLKSGQPVIGTRVALKARLAPLPTPVEPGGFDYGRRLWFESIGGTGRVTATITVVDPAIPMAARLDVVLAEMRTAMGARIHAVLDEPYASFAEALITGERSTIPADINQSLLVSGLFHILSISGLHMWLVAGGVFWTVRAGLALIPSLALHYPLKKWAAAAALAMGLFYMLLADSGVATQRSFIMIAVVFFAVLVDRPALSTRNLAIAALIVLVFEPEAAIEAGFQMSFMAVLGLVAFYEAWARLARNRDGDRAVSRHWLQRMALKMALGAAASIMTTLVAGSMSSVPAAYHFGRLSPYSLIANGLALPVIGILVMPPALLAAVLMPFGLEALPIMVMGEGLRVVLWISNWVAGFSGAHVTAAQPWAPAIAFLAGGAVTLCLLAGPIRFVAGLAFAALGAAMLFMPPKAPDIFVERAGQNAAIRNAEGLLVPAFPKRARFTVEKWLQVNGEDVKPADAARRSGWTCEDNRCDSRVKGKRIAYLSRLEGRPIDCAGLDILIADFPLRGACRLVPLRIDRFDLWRKGAHAVTIGAQGMKVETARVAQGERPWVVKPEARSTPYKPRPLTNPAEP
jgi:competence protein ComEC